jgi:N-acetylmuramoyl-L-alanine amidase
MRRLLAALLLLAGCATPLAAQRLPVVLDVGHSTASPGATSARGTPEFVFNRALADRVDTALQALGIPTRLIGRAGERTDLLSRTRDAAGAAFFLSIHHDSVQPHYLESWEHEGVLRPFSDRYAGFSLFVSRKNPRPVASLRCASAIGQSMRAAGFTPSLYHAEPIPGEMKAFADRENGVHYYDNLVVLKNAAMPAVLFEAGVIVNRAEELALQDDARRERMARAIADGVAACTRR